MTLINQFCRWLEYYDYNPEIFENDLHESLETIIEQTYNEVSGGDGQAAPGFEVVPYLENRCLAGFLAFNSRRTFTKDYMSKVPETFGADLVNIRRKFY